MRRFPIRNFHCRRKQVSAITYLITRSNLVTIFNQNDQQRLGNFHLGLGHGHIWAISFDKKWCGQRQRHTNSPGVTFPAAFPFVISVVQNILSGTESIAGYCDSATVHGQKKSAAI